MDKGAVRYFCTIRKNVVKLSEFSNKLIKYLVSSNPDNCLSMRSLSVCSFLTQLEWHQWQARMTNIRIFVETELFNKVNRNPFSFLPFSTTVQSHWTILLSVYHSYYECIENKYIRSYYHKLWAQSSWWELQWICIARKDLCRIGFSYGWNGCGNISRDSLGNRKKELSFRIL